MDRFLTSLCLNGVRTADNVPLRVTDAQTVSLNGDRVAADEVVDRALPSRVATAMVSSMAAAPAYAYSMFFLLGAQVHHGRLGDAVVQYVIRDQAHHRSALYERQVALRPVVTAQTSRRESSGTNGVAAALQYEECLLFAYDDGAVACETLRASDTAETVDEVLRTLRVISLAIFKYPANKTCAILVGTHLSTAHMAALLLASRRHVFLYVDASMSAAEVLATTAELQQVRQTLCAFGTPLPADVQHAQQRQQQQAEDGGDTLVMSSTLEALARSDAEYDVLLAAVGQELALQQQQKLRRVQERVSAAAEDGADVESMRRALGEAQAAQRAAEEALAEQRRVHRAEMMSLRDELERAQRRDGGDGDGGLGSAKSDHHTGHNPSQQLLQQPSHSPAVAHLQRALQEALKAQQFAEEKVRLLELRQSLTAMPPAATREPNGAVTSPRPSLRLPPSGAPPSVTSSGVVASPTWEQSLLQQENTALVAEFQRKEKAWQQRLRQASAEVAQLAQEKSAMEATLQLQSHTIAAAQQALAESKAAQEQEMHEVLERVRHLSLESRSLHRSRTRSVTDAAGGIDSRATSDPATASSASRGREEHGTPPPPRPTAGGTKAESGGMMSPKR